MGSIISTTSNSVEDNEIIVKKAEYSRYISEHIVNVLDAYKEYFLPYYTENKDIPCTTVATPEFHNAIYKLGSHIVEHDQSKWSESEYDAYRMNFYPTILERETPNWDILVKEKFDKAWEHHYTHNPHHPEYWVKDTGIAEDMPLDYIVEMICDWLAMSKKFNNDIHEWYKDHGIKKNYSPTTKEILEDILENVIK